MAVDPKPLVWSKESMVGRGAVERNGVGALQVMSRLEGVHSPPDRRDGGSMSVMAWFRQPCVLSF